GSCPRSAAADVVAAARVAGQQQGAIARTTASDAGGGRVEFSRAGKELPGERGAAGAVRRAGRGGGSIRRGGADWRGAGIPDGQSGRAAAAGGGGAGAPDAGVVTATAGSVPAALSGGRAGSVPAGSTGTSRLGAQPQPGGTG